MRRGLALVIGVGKYSHAGIGSLDSAVNDAERVAELLADADVCAFPPGDVVCLTDAEATRDTVVERLSGWLPARGAGAELAVVYFAGHGTAHAVGSAVEGFLLLHDSDPQNPAVRGLPMSDLVKWLSAVSADTVVVCLDCCRAGLALKFRDGTRDVSVQPAEFGTAAGKGRFLMVACDDRQKSAELAATGHGLFTKHLLDGIAGAGDRDGDGKVGLTELFEYVAGAVAAETRRLGVEQKPWTQVVAAGGEYISRPQRRDATLGGPGLPADPGAAVAVLRARAAGAAPRELEAVLRQAGRLAHPLAVPLVVPHLAHNDEAVSAMAKRAVQAIGIEATFRAIEALAKAQSTDLGPVLDGLAAFEARADLVRLLDRVVEHARGDVLVRAAALLERKQLGLRLDDMRALFRDIQSQYELRRVLGRGHYTAAYLAHDTDSDVPVVVRVLLDEYARNPESRRLFIEVCQRAKALGSEYLVKTFEFRRFPEKAYFAVCKHIDAPTLQQVLAGNRDKPGHKFAPEQALEIVRQLLLALRHVHEAGWCHGGVKPSNVFVCPKDRVVLGDLAPTVAVVASGTDKRLAYNFRYTPPELFRTAPVELRADLYALGCIAYELLCGEPPFVSDDPNDLMIEHRTGTIAPLRQRAPHLPAELEAFVGRLLARDATARPKAEDALTELDAVRAALARPTRPPDPPTQSVPPPKPLGPRPAPVGAPTPTPAPVWYYAARGAQVGPLSFDELKAAVAEGACGPADVVWAEGMPDWVAARAIEGLFPAPPPRRTQNDSDVFGASPVPIEPGPVTLPGVPLVREASLAGFRPAETRVSVGGDRPLATIVPPSERSAAESTAARVPATPRASADGIPMEFGRYSIIQVIGKGGMGTVYAAQDVMLGRQVALKVIDTGYSNDAAMRARFNREVRAMAALEHESIVPIYEAGEFAGKLYFVMPLLKGESLDSLIRRQSVPVRALLKLAREVVSGLCAAHARGFVHRDIKPGNIWIENRDRIPFSHNTWRARILDFGLARPNTEHDVTLAGAIIGTPAYMAPEQAEGLPTSAQSDLFSFGATLYRVATGGQPFVGDSMFAILRAVVTDHQRPAHELRPDLPIALSNLIDRLLEKEPANRPPSAEAVLHEIDAIVDALSQHQVPPAPRSSARSPAHTEPESLTLWQRLRRWLRGKRE